MPHASYKSHSNVSITGGEIFCRVDGGESLQKITQLETELKASKEENLALSRRNKELEQKNSEYLQLIKELQEQLNRV